MAVHTMSNQKNPILHAHWGRERPERPAPPRRPRKLHIRPPAHT